jgi:signal transduction histidine kinase
MKFRLSPKTKVAAIMVLALCLPVGALITSQLLRIYYLEETKPVHAILNQQLLSAIRMLERQIVLERDRIGAELAAHLEPADLEDCSAIRQRMVAAIKGKPYADVLVFYSPQTGPLVAPREAPPDSFELAERTENGEQISLSIAATYHRFVEMLREGPQKGGYGAVDDFLVVLKRERNQYNTAHYVLVHDAQRQPAGVLGFTLDRQYLAQKLIPEAYRKVHEAAERDKKDEFEMLDYTVLVIRDRETGMPIWASEETEMKDFQASKSFDRAVVFGFIHAKLRGKSIDQIARQVQQQNLWLVVILAAVMFGGLFYTWRSVNREIELARLKSDFVSNVSHELKTPLALIRLFAETLEMGRVRTAEKAQEYYGTIRKESERLTGLINNLLDFSRIEAGAKEYKLEPTHLPELVEQTLDGYRHHLAQKGFEIEERIAPDVPVANIDREAYTLCLLNLLDNAVKYSGDSRYLAVRLMRDNGCARLEVEDRGIGIERQDQERIFEKFYRASDPLVHNTKGSGLGLSLVKHVAQAHHGSVAVESAPGKGSKFVLKVPLDDASRN